MNEIDVGNHDRVTIARSERSMLGYLWRTVGGTVLLTLTLMIFTAYTWLTPAHADEARVVRAPGKGFYDPASLKGDAARDIRDYMDRTWVECDDLKGHGRCNLNASTESISVHYMDTYSSLDAYAVAYLAYDNDTGNRPAVRLGLWERRPDGRYHILAATDDLPLVSDVSVVRTDGTNFRVSGLTRGPNDAFCCPKTKSEFDVTVADGKLKVSDVPKPAPVSSRKYISSNGMLALMASVGAPSIATQVLSFKKAHKGKLTGFDFNFTNYAGEAPLVFFHQNSEMMMVPRHGIIAYRQPNETMQKIVEEGDTLFEGQFGKTAIVGTAYVFKAGCPPLPYRVSGPAYDFEAAKLYKTIVLRGSAPVHARNSCAVAGTTSTGPNAVLVFEPAGAYAE